MHTNKAVQKRIDELRGMSVHFVEPVIEEEKAKLASPAAVVDHVIRALADGPWVGRKAVVISGATAERVDPIRVITNRSSGRMGVELARALFHAGADVELWNAWGLVPLPAYVTTRRFETVDELFALVRDRWIKDLAGVFMPAALSDFAPVEAKSKIGSDVQKLSVEMRPLPKVILEVRKKAPRAVLVGFKAESEASTLKARAEDRLERYKADIMVANTTGGFGGPTTEVLIVDGKGKSRTLKGLKAEVARAIVETAGKRLGDKGRRA
jgi:phosphopantothenoylcysteine decarboxylase/phosphopantothenate--cysteine ligase